MEKTKFQRAHNCESPDGRCENIGMCIGAARIRAQRDPNASGCSHPEAEEARREQADLTDLTKPTPPSV